VRYLTEHPKEAQGHALFPDIIRDENDEPRLSVVRRAEILKRNLFGVDIDPQAVEITMMSLYLKALDGERSQLPPKQHLLPELKYNIICGNSLIGPEVYEQGALFGDADHDRINAFDWNSDVAGFGRIMEEGGFDCVIGNPPYVRIQHMKEWAPVEVEFYKEHYKSAGSGNYDVYVVFVEKGLSVMQERGKLGFILPNKFMSARYGKQLRSLLSSGRHLAQILNFGHEQVFEGATNYTCLLFLEKSGSRTLRFVKVDDLNAWRLTGKGIEGAIPTAKVTAGEWNFTVGAAGDLFERLRKMRVKLSDIAARIFQGIIPGADKVYCLDLLNVNRGVATCRSRALERDVRLELELLRGIVSGAEVTRYHLAETRMRVLYPYRAAEDRECELITPAAMADEFPHAFAYFKSTRRILDERDHGSAKGSTWYKYIRTQNIGLQPLPKLAVPRLVARLHCALDEKGAFCLDNVDVGGVMIDARTGLSPLYVLGLLNSRLLDFYFKRQSVPFRGNYFSANRQYIENLPIRTFDFNNPAHQALHDRMVNLAQHMLDLNKKKHSESFAPSEVQRLEREIATTDAKIDSLVCELYGVTDEERKIIEEAGP
jgi:Eco57I restriction-modification methylase/TaqI-like C-terminal specificity domain